MDPGHVATLREWAGTGVAGRTVARRARIVLLSAEGLGPTAVAAEVGCSKQTVITWRERYRTDGIAGLRDAPRSGRPASVNPLAVISRTLQVPPPRLRARRWSSRLLAAEFGVSNVAVANIWRSWGVVPIEAGGVRLATEPVFEESVAAVAAVYVAPSLSLSVLLTEGVPAEAALPMRERPRLGSRLDGLDVGAGAEVDTEEVDGFLAGLDGVPAARLHLLADRAVPEVQRWVHARGAALHAVPAGLAWHRLTRVVCVLAGASEAGAASVSDLRRAVYEHPGDRPLAWHGPAVAAGSLQ